MSDGVLRFARSPRARVGAALLGLVLVLCALAPPLFALDAATTAPDSGNSTGAVAVSVGSLFPIAATVIRRAGGVTGGAV